MNSAVLSTVYTQISGIDYRQATINVDESNKLSVSIGQTILVSNIDLGSAYANADKANWQFGFASRCGGANNKHSIDNLSISAVPMKEDTTAPTGASVSSLFSADTLYPPLWC